MSISIPRHVIFKSSAFNSTERKDHFINECCFGDDLCRWLIHELQEHGYQAEAEPGQEDFGWYIFFSVGPMNYCFLVSYRPGEDENKGDWMGTIERRSGVSALGFFLGAAKRGIQIDAANAIHSILSSTSDIYNIRWFYEEDFNNEINPKATPSQ